MKRNKKNIVTYADVFTRLYADKITSEQAADEIVSYANYRYFE